uniref:DUF4408 domain-containing protein n=1 Tax=Heterorhabditis bacteriophora TaxID=37862 RepID=A0A1I7WWF4_HETBA
MISLFLLLLPACKPFSGSKLRPYQSLAEMRDQLTKVVIDDYSVNQFEDWPTFEFLGELFKILGRNIIYIFSSRFSSFTSPSIHKGLGWVVLWMHALSRTFLEDDHEYVQNGSTMKKIFLATGKLASTMMLRSDLVAKRGKKQAIVPDENLQKGEPKPKRAAFADLSHASFYCYCWVSLEYDLYNGKIIYLFTLNCIIDALLVVIVDPCPSYDYDAENNADPNNVPEYAFDIFKYYRSREVIYRLNNATVSGRWPVTFGLALIGTNGSLINKSFCACHGLMSMSHLIKTIPNCLKKWPNLTYDGSSKNSGLYDAEFILVEIMDCCLVVYHPYRPMNSMLQV